LKPTGGHRAGVHVPPHYDPPYAPYDHRYGRLPSMYQTVSEDSKRPIASWMFE
jgi:hypothetical protein